MTYEVRYTDGARSDLLRFTDFLAGHDPDLAERALRDARARRADTRGISLYLPQGRGETIPSSANS